MSKFWGEISTTSCSHVEVEQYFDDDGRFIFQHTEGSLMNDEFLGL